MKVLGHSNWPFAFLLLLISGCLPKAPDHIEPVQFFDSLESIKVTPLPATEENRLELSKAFPPFTPVGVYQSNETSWALFDIPSRQLPDTSLYAFSKHNLHLVSRKPIDSVLIDSLECLSPDLGYEQLGFFVYPLGFCLLVSIFVSMERTIALRRSVTFPRKVERALFKGEFPDKKWRRGSAAERIVQVAVNEKASEETIKSYARLEISAMERGMYLLDVVVSGAPLIGLLGTVTGLVEVFSQVQFGGNVDKSLFSQGISLALLTTMAGLAIALPTIFLQSYLHRVLEKRSASLDWLTARLIEALDNKGMSPEIKR